MNRTPQEALQQLKDGNKRFTDGNRIPRDFTKQIVKTAQGQFPFAAIVSCIDSRVPAEIVFDQGIGDIFSARLAGNIIEQDMLGSLEFACKIAGSKLIVVMGHSGCGAIRGACDDVQMGNLTALLDKIKPVVDSVKTEGERNSNNTAFVEDVAKENVIYGIKVIKEKSPILKEMIDKGEIILVGAMYDIETGKITFYE